ncbi:MAG: hypothetical protein ACM3PZ_01355 [Bacillota bacterium]
MKKHKYLWPTLLSLVAVFAFSSLALAAPEPGGQTVNMPGVASDDSDVIAVRVLPNPNHFSAASWYRSQGFSGSPQAMLVDGYDAVRDGRTVYVNAANVNLANKLIYTNIYLISYNQNPDFKTVDALGQMVKHWQFNSNLATPGYCSISTLRCSSDTDCSEGYECVGEGEAPGRCLSKEDDACNTDKDCASGIYCDNVRSKVSRDVRRLSSLIDLRTSLTAFREANGKYPVMGAGTYLPLRSLSVWPSWQASLLPQLGASQSMADPVNHLGQCAGFDPVTCWNAENKTFADPHPSDDVFELPAGSYAFAYKGDANGSNFTLCSSMETKALGFNTAEGNLADYGCVASGAAYIGSSENNAPVLVSVSLQGESDQEFAGFIRVIDPDGNPLSWTLNTAGTSWTNWKNGGVNNAAPIIQDTANPSQKKIYAQAAGNSGKYNMSIIVDDGRGGTLATVTPIVVGNGAPVIRSDDIEYYPSSVIPLMVKFSITDKHQPFSYTIAKSQYSSGPFDLLSSANAQFLGESVTKVGDTSYYILKYNIIPAPKYGSDQNFVYTVSARDAYNNVSTRQINILVKADHPKLDLNCPKAVRLNAQYYCGLGWRNQGDHTIVYSAVGNLPAGLAIVSSENIGIDTGGENDLKSPDGGGEVVDPAGKDTSFLPRLMAGLQRLFPRVSAASPSLFYALSGKPTRAISSFPVKIKAMNEYGADTVKEFALDINTYCGDGAKQQPNQEGRGGYYNDGQEDCDGNSGIILDRARIASSSSQLRYGCTTLAGEKVPYPITTNQFCVYKGGGPEEGGGYCGDGVCQFKLLTSTGLVPWEAEKYCMADCFCDGLHQFAQGAECLCEEGWRDCDGLPGCESDKQCEACPAGQYNCGNACYNTTSFKCGMQSPTCYTGGTSCTGSCAVNMYNCDGINGCDGPTCTCPAGQSWDNAPWPNGKCVAESTCASPLLECNGACYNPNTQKCCSSGDVCGANQVCCGATATYPCASSAAFCVMEVDPIGGGGTPSDGGR